MSSSSRRRATATVPKITRGRTGCFTCRRRRKKCDEMKPGCANCIRSGYVCEGYQTAVRYSENQSRSSGPGFSTRLPARPPSPDLPIDSPGPWFLYDEPTLDYPPPVPFAGLDTLQRSAIELPVPNSDADIYDLDATYQASLSGNLTPSPGSSVEARSPTSETFRANQHLPPVPRGLPFLIDGIETMSERCFFMHFTNTTSRVLTSRTDDTNPLLTMLLPLSLKDSMVRKAILSVGASHLGKLQPSRHSSYATEKARLLRGAENEQIQRIGAARDSNTPMTRSDLDAILSCTLLLCLYEVSEGSGDLAWQVRLEVARDLVQNALDDESSASNPFGLSDAFSSVDEFLLEFFVYHDVLASVTDPTRIPILTSGRRHTADEVGSVSYMMGVDDGLFDIIARVAALRSNVSYGDKIFEALSIWEELDRWEPKGTDDQRNAGLAYIQAIFVWLYLIIHPLGVREEKVRTAVSQGWKNMEQIQGNGVMAFLLFPTFVLGFTSITSEQRGHCTAQFDRLKGFSGLGNIGMAYNLVKQSWLACDEGMPRFWDWVQQMQSKGVSLLVT